MPVKRRNSDAPNGALTHPPKKPKRVNNRFQRAESGKPSKPHQSVRGASRTTLGPDPTSDHPNPSHPAPATLTFRSRNRTNHKKPLKAFLASRSGYRPSAIHLPPCPPSSSTAPSQNTSVDDTYLSDGGSYYHELSEDNEEHSDYTIDDAQEAVMERLDGQWRGANRTNIQSTAYIPTVRRVAAVRNRQSRMEKARTWCTQTLPRLVRAYLDCTAQTRNGVTTAVKEPICTCGMISQTVEVDAVRELGK